MNHRANFITFTEKRTMLHRPFLIIAWLLLMAGQQGSTQTFYHTGSDADTDPAPIQGILLAGGASDNDDAMRWFLERANGGDVVVIRATGSDGYNNYLFSGLGVEVNSVTSIVIPTREAAGIQEVYDAMVRAEAIFIAGGNQWNYINHWKNTLVHDALSHLIHEKRITIGGTSAGLAVLGEVVYSAQNNTVWSSEALENPYHYRVTLDREFLDIPYLEQVVTDSHYNRPEGDEMTREGRHVAFMARMATDWDMAARGIGVNEYTAVAVDEEGLARIFGDPDFDDFAYFLDAAGSSPEVCQEGAPLTWNRDGKALSVYKVPGNEAGSNTFDLVSWEQGSGGEWSHWYVREGALYFGPASSLSIEFRVLQGINEAPVEGARVVLNDHGEMTTDSEGQVVFSDVEAESTFAFSVAKEGFITEQGEVNMESQSLSLTVFLYPGENTSGRTGISAPGGIRLFPNPATDYLFLEEPFGNPIGRMKLVNSLGLEVIRPVTVSTGPGSIRADVSHVVPGLYFILFTAGGQRQSMPVIITR